MQRILEKYQKKIKKLNMFEMQTLRSLIAQSTSNGMSRFYMVFDQSQKAMQTIDHSNNTNSFGNVQNR